MMVSAIAPSRVATASTGTDCSAMGRLATMRTTEPTNQLDMVITDR